MFAWLSHQTGANRLSWARQSSVPAWRGACLSDGSNPVIVLRDISTDWPVAGRSVILRWKNHLHGRIRARIWTDHGGPGRQKLKRTKACRQADARLTVHFAIAYISINEYCVCKVVIASAVPLWAKYHKDMNEHVLVARSHLGGVVLDAQAHDDISLLMPSHLLTFLLISNSRCLRDRPSKSRSGMTITLGFKSKQPSFECPSSSCQMVCLSSRVSSRRWSERATTLAGQTERSHHEVENHAFLLRQVLPAKHFQEHPTLFLIDREVTIALRHRMLRSEKPRKRVASALWEGLG